MTKATAFYDKGVKTKSYGDMVTITGTSTQTHVFRNGMPVEPYQTDDTDTVTVHLPRKKWWKAAEGEMHPATVNWSAMGDRAPELALAYAALIRKGARLAAKANKEAGL